MQVTEMRELLTLHLQGCSTCNDILEDNAPLLFEEGQQLSDTQVAAVYEHMMEKHEEHRVQ